MPTLLSQYMMSILFKGQLISKENFGVHKSTKKQLGISICALASKMGKIINARIISTVESRFRKA